MSSSNSHEVTVTGGDILREHTRDMVKCMAEVSTVSVFCMHCCVRVAIVLVRVSVYVFVAIFCASTHETLSSALLRFLL